MSTVLWINVLLAVPFIALWAGIPMWLVLRRQESAPAAPARAAAAPVVRPLPEPRVHAAYRRAA